MSHLPDKTLTITYKDQESYELAMYSIGQGGIVNYTGDPDRLTITMKRSEQVAHEDDPWSSADMLEEFEEQWCSYTTVEDADPEGMLGLASITVLDD